MDFKKLMIFALLVVTLFIWGCNTNQNNDNNDEPTVLQPEDVFPQNILDRLRTNLTLENNQLEITYIANHGYLFRTGGTKILIDSLSEIGGGYERAMGVVLEMFNEERFPFNSIRLALTTHSHGDHFEADRAVDFLIANSQTFHLSTAEVANMIAAQPNGSQVANRSVGSSPPVGTRETVVVNDFTVELFGVDHHGIVGEGYDHVAMMFTLNGIKILHVGDACKLPNQYANLGLENENIDILIAPFGHSCSNWCEVFEDQNAYTIIRDYIKPKHIIMSHMNFDDSNAFLQENRRRMEENIPGIPISVFHPTILNQKIYTKEDNRISAEAKPM
jgi:L-ascorbate metabolism protein UlaG (beta-lactamase superfamily)